MSVCKDCGKIANAVKACKRSHLQSAVCPGPRCLACWRAEKKRRSKASHGSSIEKKYGIDEDEYDYIYAYQGGKCAICRIATGARKRLAVDHNHTTGEVRGVLCGPCNKMLGLARDLPEFFERAADYLRDPPARKALNDRTSKGVVQG